MISLFMDMMLRYLSSSDAFLRFALHHIPIVAKSVECCTETASEPAISMLIYCTFLHTAGSWVSRVDWVIIAISPERTSGNTEGECEESETYGCFNRKRLCG